MSELGPSTTVTQTPETKITPDGEDIPSVARGEDPIIYADQPEAWSEEVIDPENPGYIEPNPEDYLTQEQKDALVQKVDDNAKEKVAFRVKAMNGLDRAQRIATLKTARQYRMEGRVARLERKLEKSRPHSARHMRIEGALNRANYRLGNIVKSQDKVFNRMYSRSYGYESEIAKVAEIEKKKNTIIAKRKVALENKRRRKIKIRYTKELKKTDPSLKDRLREELLSDKKRREHLYKEILSWKGNSMRKFETDLLEEVENKYLDRRRVVKS